MKLRQRLVIPYTAYFAVITLISAVTSLTVIGRYLDGQQLQQLQNAGQLLASNSFASNPAVLMRAKELTGIEFISFKGEQDLIATTLDARHDQGLIDAVLSVFRQPSNNTAVEGSHRKLEHAGQRYQVAFRAITPSSGSQMAMIYPPHQLELSKRHAKWILCALFLLFFLALTGLTHVLASTITRPIVALVAHTQALAEGRRSHQDEHVSIDEIESLRYAFNEMSDKLLIAENKLIHSEKLAIAGQLAARVAHDVRNPLSTIKMQAQLLRSRLSTDDRAMDSARKIIRQADRVEFAIRELLDLSRPETLDRQTTDINALITETLDLIMPQLQHQSLTHCLRLAPDMPTLQLDRERIQRALLNILNNAVEAMPNGGELAIESHVDPASNALTIMIKDAGTGIPDGVEDQLFDPFFTTKRDGVGLGLVNCLSIMEAHQGRIELSRRRGGGTVASLFFPIYGVSEDPPGGNIPSNPFTERT